jgi:hypothetical protein
MRTSTVAKGIIAAAAVALPLVSQAGSTVTTAAVGGKYTAAVTLNFQVTIPQILYLRVGTGSTYTTGALTTVASGAPDNFAFAPAAANVGNGTAVPASSGGDISTGVATAALIGNGGGPITLVATNGGALSDGAGDTINYNQITTTSATLHTATNLPAPILGNGTSSTVTLTPASGNVVYEDAQWTFAYANTAGVVPGAGVYGGTVTPGNNGTVTYTATMP